MIRIADALTLAITKFKTRRIRLGIAVFISGLLFVAFSAVSFIARGTMKSIDDFTKEGFAGRYITHINPVSIDPFAVANDKEAIAQAKEIDKKFIADKKAEAKRLGIDYDPTTEQLSVPSNKDASGKVMGDESIDINATQVQALLHQKDIQSSKKFLDAIAESKQNYSVKGIYKGVSLAGSYGPSFGTPPLPSVSLIKNGAEVQQDQNNPNYAMTGVASIINSWTLLDDQLITPFLLPNQSLITTDDTVPLVAPYSAIEEILGLQKLPSSASSKDKLERLKQVRNKGAGTTFTVCVRNQTSTSNTQEAASQQQEIAANKGNKDYQKPDFIKEKSTNPCEDVKTTRDVRDADTKALATKQEQFAQKFGKVPAAQRIIHFKIIGIVADPPMSSSFSIEDLVGSLLSSNLGIGWFTPRSALDKLPEYKASVVSQDEVLGYSSNRYVELADAATTKKFVKDQTCTPTSFSVQTGPGIPKECEEKKQYFFVDSFGSNSVAMEGIRAGFSKYFLRALLFASIISALILMGTVGRIMADSRRETAVFRAIGAKRLDIAQIYLTYVCMIGTAISLFAVFAGFLLANLFDAHFSSGLTIKALLAYNASDLSRQFHTRSLDRADIGWLVLIILAASLLSAVLPLLTNLKRNPIADMRDER